MTAATSGEAGVRFRFSPDVVTRELDEGVLLVNLETGQTWKLNHVGAAVCRGIEQGADLPHITGDVAGRYGVDVATARRDIDLLVAALRQQGLLEHEAAG